MTLIEKGLLLVSAFLVPLSNLRLGGVNLTYFDIAILLLFIFQVVRTGRLPSLHLFYWASAAMLVAAALSGIGAAHPGLVIDQLVQWGFIFFIAVPAVFVAAADPSSARIVVVGVGAACVFLAVHGMVEVLTGEAEYIAGRYQGFHNSSQLLAFSVASFLAYVFIAPGVLSGSRRSSVVLLGMAAGLLTAALAWLIFMTASRSGMIAGLVAPVIAIVLSQRTGLSLDLDAVLRRCFKLLVVFAAFAGALVAMLSFASPEALAVVERRIALSMDPSSSVIAGRTRGYSEAWASLDLNAILRGVGLENYPFSSARGQRPHNVLLMFLWEGGIVFLAGFIVLVGIFVQSIAQPARSWATLRQPHRYVAAAAAAGFCAFLVIAMFNTQSIHRMYWFNYAYVLGALAFPQGRA